MKEDITIPISKYDELLTYKGKYEELKRIIISNCYEKDNYNVPAYFDWEGLK